MSKHIYTILLLLCCFSAFAQDEEYIEQERVSEFEEIALEKARDLGTYIEIISDKDSRPSDVSEAIELAIGLFLDEYQRVQVSSLNRTEIQSFPIREYLDRIRLLSYRKVEIEWFDVHQVSDIKLGTDGKYHGVITVYQRFKGYGDDEIVYEDVTEKNIEVILDKISKNVGGTIVNNWDVFLGDLNVIETREK